MTTPLLQRDAALQLIDEVVFDRRNGVAFTGEPGIGRSVLLAAAHRQPA